jgi:hypothetical protein
LHNTTSLLEGFPVFLLALRVYIVYPVRVYIADPLFRELNDGPEVVSG